VLPESRERAGAINSASAADSSISGSIRCFELRLAISTVGQTAIIGPGAWWITYPIQFEPISVAPSCAAFMNATRSTGEVGDRQSMIAFRYGVRLVRQRPGSADALLESIRWRSDHSDTVSSGSGVKPSRHARSISTAPS
jgi:hypothetical protein